MLTSHRKLIGMTHEEVARRMGRSPSMVSELECAAGNLTIATMELWAQAVWLRPELGFVYIGEDESPDDASD